jgi:hypothetical protein
MLSDAVLKVCKDTSQAAGLVYAAGLAFADSGLKYKSSPKVLGELKSWTQDSHRPLSAASVPVPSVVIPEAVIVV